MSRVISYVTLFVCAAAIATPVAAQDVRVKQQDKVRVVIADEVLAEIQRIVQSAVGANVAREISQAMRDVQREVSQINREIARDLTRDLPRDITSEVRRHVGNVHVSGAGFEQNKDFKAEQIDRQTKTLAIGAAGELVLKNVVGDITVKAGGSKDATIEIVRISKGRTDADAKTGLEKVTTEIVSKGERATVSVNYPNEQRPPYAVSVAYSVTAPAGTRVSIETVTGDVSVNGIKGDLSVGGVSSNVNISASERVMSVRTISGDITLTDVANPGKLEAGTISGDLTLKNVKADRLEAGGVAATVIAHEVRATGVIIKTMSGDIEYSGSLDARGRYEFRAHSGDVRLAVNGGFDLEATTFSGELNADASMGISKGTERRSLRGTVGSGGAAVVASTFSGDVWVGRKIK